MLPAALCHVRQREVTDLLVDLFIRLVLKINTRAEGRQGVERRAEEDPGRGGRAAAECGGGVVGAVRHGAVRWVSCSVVGGERTLKALAAEAAANEARYQARSAPCCAPCARYTGGGCSPPFFLLGALGLTCSSTVYRPVMDAIDLLKRYLKRLLKEGACFGPAETVPLAGVVPEQWRAAVVDERGAGRAHSVRAVRVGRAVSGR